MEREQNPEIRKNQFQYIYSIDSEVERVRYTFEKRSFYIENGIRVTVPQGVTTKNIHEQTHLRELIKQELNENRAGNAAEMINEFWENNGLKVKSVINNLGLQYPDILNLKLTQYGAPGGYTLPNLITIHMASKVPFEAIVHEVVHLAIEARAKEQELDFTEREQVVDYILVNYLGDVISSKFRWGEPSEELLHKFGLK